MFVIEGEDIANAVFDVLETEAEAVSVEELRQLLRDESAALNIVLTEEDISRILGDVQAP